MSTALLGPPGGEAGANTSTTSANSSSSNKGKSKSGKESGPTETRSVVFEWTLTNLREIFAETAGDAKSKVIKSCTFDEGRWSVFFYAQNGPEQNVSLYLNAEPTFSEKSSVWATAASRKMSTIQGLPEEPLGKSAKKDGMEWFREGSWRFVFTAYTLNRQLIASKEAPGYSFSHIASNWGWSSFCPRDRLYYNNPLVREADAFIISVTLTCTPVPARGPPAHGFTIPKALSNVMGDLLDDPDHSDIVFDFPSRKFTAHDICRKRRKGSIYAIRKILVARSEYFQDMMQGGFAEAEAETASSEGEGSRGSGSATNQDAMLLDNQVATEAGTVASIGRDTDVSIPDPDWDYDSDNLFADSDDEYEVHDDENDDDEDGASRRGDIKRDPDVDSPSQASDSGDAGDGSRQSNGAERKGENEHDADDDEEEAAVAEDEIAALSRNTVVKQEEGTQGRHRRDTSDGVDTGLAGQFSGLNTTKGKKRAARDDHGEGSRKKRDRKRVHITILDANKTTFQALLYYLYTDQIEFAPLVSSCTPPRGEDLPSNAPVTRDTREEVARSVLHGTLLGWVNRREILRTHPGSGAFKIMPCSAKSIYRLADKMNLTDLKQRAKEHIQKNLTERNIVWELFSNFTARYPEIRKMETEFALHHWSKIKKTGAMKGIFHRGSVVHAGLSEVWPHLLSRLEYKNGNESDSDESSSSEEEE